MNDDILAPGIPPAGEYGYSPPGSFARTSKELRGTARDAAVDIRPWLPDALAFADDQDRCLGQCAQAADRMEADVHAAVLGETLAAVLADVSGPHGLEHLRKWRWISFPFPSEQLHG